MMNWLHYLVEANIYLGVFYLFYFLFFKNETHYTLNRAYLMCSCIIAFVLPLVQVGVLKPTGHAIQNVLLIKPNNLYRIHLPAPAVSSYHFGLQEAALTIYLFGASIFLVLLIIKLMRLWMLTRIASSIYKNNYKLIYINDSNTAFSFFNYLFIGTQVPCADTIIKHELVHIRQRHSFDIIFLEIFKIVNWFNPMIYLLQNSLRALHEYIADEETVLLETDALSYSAFLVSNAYGISGSSITHSFFNFNLLKNRIIMLHQKRSGGLARLKYLIALPVCAAMLCASTLGFSKTYGWIDLAPMKTSDTSKNIRKTAANKTIIHTNQFITAKGYKVEEKTTLNNGDFSQQVLVTDNNGELHTYLNEKISASDRAMLLDKYSYKFPNKKITNVILTPPPPPPAAPDKLIRFPKPKPLGLTKTGYKYDEAGYLVNNKTNYSVIIIEKNGSEKEYFKTSATPDELNLLKNKYGYTFPTMKIYPQLPPPPPMPPATDKSLLKAPVKPIKIVKVPAPKVTNIKLPVKVTNVELTFRPFDTVQLDSTAKDSGKH